MKIEVYSEGRADEGLLDDLRTAIRKDNAHELVKENPDIVMVLGDRPAALKRALKAVEDRIPVAHISGGEKTTGVVDDYIRHAISKLSHVHFTAADEYKARVEQLGEHPDTVYWVGEPGLDSLETEDIIFLEEHFIVTYHPTLNDENLDDLFDALMNLNRKIIFTAPNKDKGYKTVVKKIKEFMAKKDNCEYHEYMGRKNYLAHLKWARAVIGNSSSGIVEAASFGTPCVNIGDRQEGRIKGTNVYDCELAKGAIMEAIMKSKRLEISTNPYRKDGKAIENILLILKSLDLKDIMRKEFVDIV